LSVFTRVEAKAIVAYLIYRRGSDPESLDKDVIDAALDLYWLEHVAKAPLAQDPKQHLTEEVDYLAAISSDVNGGAED